METFAQQKLMVERFMDLNSPKAEQAENGPGIGKKLFDFIHDKVLEIPEPPTRGKWKGGDPIPDYKPGKVKLVKERTDMYNGIGVVPSRIAQKVVNDKSHMVTMSNRGEDFDLIMTFIIRMWKYLAKAVIVGLLGMFMFFTNPYLWPVALLFGAYSAFFSAQFVVTRNRIFAIRSFACLDVNLGLPYLPESKVPKPRVN